MIRILSAALAALVLSAAVALAQPGLAGEIRAVGSKSGTEVISLWANSFMEEHPGVKIDAVGSGSGTAFPALIGAKSDLAPMSRPMSLGMIDEFARRRGYPPLEVKVGIGGVVVFVHPSNPIRGITRAQLDGMYSNTYFLAERALLTWGDAGLSGDWTTRPVALYSIPESSGPWGQFRAETSTMASYFKPEIRQLPTVAEVAAGVASDRNGIGFAPIGFRSDAVKVLPVASLLPAGSTYAGYQVSREAGRRARDFIAPTPENIAAEIYPLTRYFRIYVDHDRRRPMDPAMRAFLLHALSDASQARMADAGYMPLPQAALAEERRVIARLP
jgi:phosphate transport system substrate-binding protein